MKILHTEEVSYTGTVGSDCLHLQFRASLETGPDTTAWSNSGAAVKVNSDQVLNNGKANGLIVVEQLP